MKLVILISFLSIIGFCSAELFGVHCMSNEFRCASGKCIPKSSLCNRFPDCSDGSDETPSACEKANAIFQPPIDKYGHFKFWESLSNDVTTVSGDTRLPKLRGPISTVYGSLTDDGDAISKAANTMAGGAIAGVVIAPIVILIICVACCYCCCCRRGRDVIIQNNAGAPAVTTNTVVVSAPQAPAPQPYPQPYPAYAPPYNAIPSPAYPPPTHY